MQFSHALIALVAATLANAQLPNVPACSLNCFVTALTTDGCSELTDFACHCQKTSLVGTITPCVQKACEVSDQISVSNAVVEQCSSAGHPIVVPPIETTSASSSASASASETTSSSAPAETSATATATASGSSSASESSSATGSATASSSSGSGASSSGAASSTPLATKTGSASASASSPIYTGAAANVKGNMAGVAVLAAAAAYVL
ncbi:hypothetical protein N7499_010730 [Penicillium canescens]|uniref:CFEM domain-containing protein n=1 Tax=Penicillium canescens TaxID=5083 RepID=A0AAD6IIY5_PENCN|nr:uncharacterized protein N7446_005998 [Penicillium canescens]KAJ5990203.1 hypothetical protein N7522_010410 [Penicillium canescens]KAJ6051366.1 hypothetical protein N7460_001900 [Penicillium canescens]KAJ6061878.1 hypothetical protein N7446_005998 [Penicillium canescens]KAJ6065128.1 hypothetical protein N7444_000781 [Penicillium canescens]KAJ6068843.1 hypothetical protein N7499_010730 [Penicillium canescens]